MFSVGEEKAFDKIQHLFILKSLNKPRIDGDFMNLMKGISKIS